MAASKEIDSLGKFNVEAMENFSWASVEEQLQLIAPVWMKTLKAALGYYLIFFTLRNINNSCYKVREIQMSFSIF